jgi:hypothetical protein
MIDEGATTADLTRALRSFLKRPAQEDVVLLYYGCQRRAGPGSLRESLPYHPALRADRRAGQRLPRGVERCERRLGAAELGRGEQDLGRG